MIIRSDGLMLAVNDLIKYGDIKTNQVERILWIDEDIQWIFVIDVSSDKAFPVMKKGSEIIGFLETGLAAKLDQDSLFKVVDEESLTDKEKSIREKAWNIISPLISSDNEPDIYQKNKRGPQVKATAENNNISIFMVYKYLRRYWQRGKTKNALIPDYANSGGLGKPKKAGAAKRGRPRKNTSDGAEGINVTESIKRIFSVATHEFLLNNKNNKKISQEDLYKFMIGKYFCENIYYENGIKKSILLSEAERPSRKQFEYWYNIQNKPSDIIIARQGKRKYQKDHRALLKTSTQEVFGPGSRYQIDATIADVYLVSKYNRNWIIGRPVLYFVIDVFSRMITGMYVGLEGPSWLGAMMALVNAATDKISFCKEYAIDINLKQWPCAHMPDAILGDRGEMESHMVDTLINSLNVRIENAAPYRADWKGIVERFFRTVQGKVKPLLPGYIDVDFHQRGGTDYRLDAKLDLYQFTQLIIECVLYYNNQHLLRNYEWDEMMIEDDIDLKSISLWNWGIVNRSGRLRSFAEDIVKLNLLPTDHAIVTFRGIKFKSMYYSCEQAMKEMWFDKARNKGSWKIDISFDPRNMNLIYLRDERGRSFEKCRLIEGQDKYVDKNMADIQYLLEYEKLRRKKQDHQNLQEQVDLNSKIEQIVKQASQQTEQVLDQTVSNAKRVKSIKENRRLERELIRRDQSFELGAKDTFQVQPASVTSLVEKSATENVQYPNKLALLKKKQQEKLQEKK